MGRVMSKSVRSLTLAACLLIGLIAPAMAADLENSLYLDVPKGRVVIELRIFVVSLLICGSAIAALVGTVL